MQLLATLVAQRDWDDHMWANGGWMWFWGTLMMIGSVAAIALIVWLIVRVSHPQAPPGAMGPDDGMTRARAILAERYARGEISTEEYQERVAGLR